MPTTADKINEIERQPKRGRAMLIERTFTRGAAGNAIWKRRRVLSLGLLTLAFGAATFFLARTATGTGRVASFAIRCMLCACSCSRRKRTSSARESSFLSLIHDSEKYVT